MALGNMELELEKVLEIKQEEFFQVKEHSNRKISVLSENIFPMVPIEEYFLMYTPDLMMIFDSNLKLIQRHSSEFLFSYCTFGVLKDEIVSLAGLNNGVIVMVRSKSRENIELQGHNNLITCIKYVKNERILSSSLDFTIRLWDLQTQSMLVIYEAHKAGVLSVDFHIEKNYFGSCGRDSFVIIWKKIKTSKKFCKKFYGCFRPHTNYVNKVVLFGEIVITLGDDHNLLIWRPYLHKKHFCIDVLAKFITFSTDFFLLNPFRNVLLYKNSLNSIVIHYFDENTETLHEFSNHFSSISLFRSQSTRLSYLLF